MPGAGEVLNVREVADTLGIEPWRLARLARYLGLDPGEKYVPSTTVQRISQLDHEEDRYRAIRNWLLESLARRRRPSEADR